MCSEGHLAAAPRKSVHVTPATMLLRCQFGETTSRLFIVIDGTQIG
jgi:hypothetical protein